MKYILIIFLLIPGILNAQKKQILDGFEINDSTKLIGIASIFDKSKKHDHFNFYIDDKKTIDSLRKILTYSDKVPTTFEQNNFDIILIQDNKEVKLWMANPISSTWLFDGASYKFDLKILDKLSKKFPAKFFTDEKKFKDQAEYDQYLSGLKTNANFIYSFNPDFKFEGSFEIEFPKNEKFPHPKAISEFLEKEILKITNNKDQFRIRYTLNKFNSNNPNQYTMTIECNRDVFDMLKLENLSNKNWALNEPMSRFYFKK